jgi:hypothetical protein
LISSHFSRDSSSWLVKSQHDVIWWQFRANRGEERKWDKINRRAVMIEMWNGKSSICLLSSVIKSCSRDKARHDTKWHESDTTRHTCLSVPARYVSHVVFLNVAWLIFFYFRHGTTRTVKRSQHDTSRHEHDTRLDTTRHDTTRHGRHG